MNDREFSLYDIEQFLREAGAEKVTEDAVLNLEKELAKLADKVTGKAIRYAAHAGRKKTDKERRHSAYQTFVKVVPCHSCFLQQSEYLEKKGKNDKYCLKAAQINGNISFCGLFQVHYDMGKAVYLPAVRRLHGAISLPYS